MRYAVLVARLLLGLVFLVFGANHIVPFLPMPPMAGDAGIFAGILQTHRYFAIIGLVEVIAGLLLLVGRFVPLALTLLAPIIVNIFLFQALIAHEGVAIGVVLLVAEVFLLFIYRRSFLPLLLPAADIGSLDKL